MMIITRSSDKLYSAAHGHAMVGTPARRWMRWAKSVQEELAWILPVRITTFMHKRIHEELAYFSTSKVSIQPHKRESLPPYRNFLGIFTEPSQIHLGNVSPPFEVSKPRAHILETNAWGANTLGVSACT